MSSSAYRLRVLMTGGGSGGHIYPLLAVLEASREAAALKNISLELFYLGPKDEYSAMVASAGVAIGDLMNAKWRRYFSWQNFLDVPKFFISFFQALGKVFWVMPDVIFSKGGPGALPVVLAGWFYRIPVIIHESDAVPGLTNALSSRMAKKIFVSFEHTLSYFDPRRTLWVGHPLRRELVGVPPSPGEAKKSLGFAPDVPLLLVVGGSQGAERLNEFFLKNARQLVDVVQVLHQTGRAHYEAIRKLSGDLFSSDPSLPLSRRSWYKIVPYLEENLLLAFGAADLVVSRGGSGMIFEIAAFGKPAIVIPLSESANDHQRVNAYEFAKSGAAVVIEEGNLVAGILIKKAEEILKDPLRRERMEMASRKFFKEGAAERIAQELLQFVNK